MKVVLISCVSMKLNYESRVQDLYVSPLFKKNLCYARSLNPDEIFILSAKHGLLGLKEKINPYNTTLNNMKSNNINEWANQTLKQLKKETDLENDEFIFLAGNKYRKFLLPYIKHYKIPMEGLGIGKQLQWLTRQNE